MIGDDATRRYTALSHTSIKSSDFYHRGDYGTVLVIARMSAFFDQKLYELPSIGIDNPGVIVLAVTNYRIVT